MTAEAPQDTVEIEVDFDDWLNGGERKAHFVTLYSRADLYADIEALQAQRVSAVDIPEEDRGLGGVYNPNAELDAQIDALWLQLGASKKEFRVSARTQEELDEIKEAVEVELKDEIESLMERARRKGRDMARQLGVTAVQEVNNMVRKSAVDARTGFVYKEMTFRGLAASTSIRQGDTWVPLTYDQVKSLENKLGGSQMELLNRAYSRAANEAPIVDLPK